MAAPASSTRPLPNLKDYVFTEKLGQGSYATVYKAFRKTAEREVVAVKCVQKSSLTKQAVENLLTEIEILKKVKSEHVVELKDFQWDACYIYLIMEFCAGGDLSKFIRQKRKLPESVVQRFLQQLGTALKFMRQMNICHMDLKPQNILLSSTSNPKLKLADFGLAQYLQSGEEATALRGSLLYMAPEMLLKRHYDARVDLWSLGIILFECLFGQAPFSSEKFEHLVEKIKNEKPIEIPYGVELSDECRDLILRLLNRNPDERITFEQFFAHPFLDLEHMPSSESYNKGVRIIQSAVQTDNSGDPARASQLYFEGLLYLVPIVRCEPDKRKRDALRVKVQEYLSRAETLRSQIRSTRENSLTDETDACNTKFNYYDSKLNEAIDHANRAEELLFDGFYKNSFNLFTIALEVIVKSLKEMNPGPEKEILHSKTNYWLRKAEEAKSLYAVEKLQVKEVVDAVRRGEDLNDISSTLGANCSIQ